MTMTTNEQSNSAQAPFICGICKTEDPKFAWTDTHGVAQCWTCGAPYRLLHYVGNERVEKEPSLSIKDEFVPLITEYWNETHSRIPSGHSFPGGQEIATQTEAHKFHAWMKAHRAAATGAQP